MIDLKQNSITDSSQLQHGVGGIQKPGGLREGTTWNIKKYRKKDIKGCRSV